MRNKQINKIYILNSLLVLGVILTGWFLGGLWPFGDRSMAIIDLGSQYLGMYDYIGKVLSGQDGLLYSFNKGAGGGMYSLWTYYLMPLLISMGFGIL